MEEVGFLEEPFGDEAVESGRALVRKYDGNWEMRTVAMTAAAERMATVMLSWKGHPARYPSAPC